MSDHAAVNSGFVQLKDSSYDILRFLVEKLFPAASALYAAFAVVWGWGYIAQVSGSFAALAVFGGVLLTFARKGYEPLTDVPRTGYDGQVVEDVIDGDPVLRVELTNDAKQNLMNKPQIVIKGYDASA